MKYDILGRMDATQQNFTELLELANHYPSPHNGQPIRAKRTGESTLELYFETSRGLQAAEVSFLFSFVTMGVFAAHLALCAQALGHHCEMQPTLPTVEDLKHKPLLKFASSTVSFNVAQPNMKLRETLLSRQTSRKKYFEGISEALSNATIAIAAKHKQQLVKMGSGATKHAIWLNQRAVFDDMFDEAVRHELDHWLRYSNAEKEQKHDGLSYDCMELNGHLMKFMVRHYKLLRAPGIGQILREYYLRTMSDNSDVFYMLAPFSTEQQAYEVGIAVMQIWQAIATEGYYLHPFGTIMSNDDAHRDFLKLAHIDHEDKTKNFMVFIYRAGKSIKPNASLRIPVKEHLEMN